MQAVLIIAHRDIEQVAKLADYLRENFFVYIHIDKKYVLSNSEREMLDMQNVEYFQEVSASWGAWSISEVAYRLFKRALLNPEVEYVHLISGQDWPVYPPEKIYRMFEGDKNAYMRIAPAEGTVKSHESLIWWQKLYFNYDKIDRKTTFGKIYHRVSIAVQLILGVNKLKKYGITYEILQGSEWLDAPRDLIEYLIETFDGNQNLKKVFSTGFCSDEFWVQTILGNSEHKNRIVNKELRFIKWEKRHGSYPAILDETDIEDVKGSKDLFMRKVTLEHSRGLMENFGLKESFGERNEG